MKPSYLRTFSLLIALTLTGVVIAGYHPGAEDDSVYLAAVQHDLNPQLFRVDSDFFALKLKATIFDKLMAAMVRITHIPVPNMELLWHLLTIFAILAACYRITSRCFLNPAARWCGLTMVTVFFTLPIAGTALYLVDQNLVPRAISTALILFAVDSVLGRRLLLASLLAAVAFLFHPIIAAFGISLCLFLAMPTQFKTARSKITTYSIALPVYFTAAINVGSLFDRSTVPPALHAAISMHHYCQLANWEWYEWLGAIAPVFILLWFARIAKDYSNRNNFHSQDQSELSTLKLLATRTALFGTFQFLVALVIMLTPTLERLRPLEPMRYLHVIYILMILLGGCYIGEQFLRQHVFRWVALFVPAAFGMFIAQRALYPASHHLELPGIESTNPWLRTFAWVRNNTPEDAYFALGPDYMHSPGEDSHGFRALALRSAMADNVKDSGMVLTSAPLADRWQLEVDAQNAGHEDWEHVSAADLYKLKAQFGVNWVILEHPVPAIADCPYQDQGLVVCRID